MGAAMQATGLPCGMICAPGQRYHPAIVAQAAATLAEMFPQRFWLELGSGEAINERITGDGLAAKGSFAMRGCLKVPELFAVCLAEKRLPTAGL